MTLLNLAGTALAAFAAAAPLTAMAADPITWPDGKKAAIVLTYDDALPTQLDNALPALDARGLKGTFFLTVESGDFSPRLEEWKAVAAEGHELANHTLFHPCRGGEGREWVRPDTDLDTYSLERLVTELKLTSALLDALDGGAPRTFAYTCGDTTVSGESFVEAIKPMFLGARTVQQETPVLADGALDAYRIGTYAEPDPSGADLIAYAEGVLEAGGIGTYLFHGIGGDHLVVSTEAHADLLDWLVDHEDEVWVTTFRDAMTWLREEGAAE